MILFFMYEYVKEWRRVRHPDATTASRRLDLEKKWTGITWLGSPVLIILIVMLLYSVGVRPSCDLHEDEEDALTRHAISK